MRMVVKDCQQSGLVLESQIVNIFSRMLEENTRLEVRPEFV